MAYLNPYKTKAEVPSRLESYTICEKLGEGASGEIFRAIDTTTQQQVALKCVGSIFAVSPQELARVKREAKILSSLNHPNICKTKGTVSHNDRLYLVLEYIEGVSLAQLMQYCFGANLFSPDTTIEQLIQLIRQTPMGHHPAPKQALVKKKGVTTTPLPRLQALKLVEKIADALSYAHGLGVLHRDIKPANIMLRADGEPVILDFGTAKITQTIETQQLTKTGEFLGSIGYSAPEQLKNLHSIDERADIFSMGVILYELLTATRYFIGSKDLMQDYFAFLKHRPAPPRKLNAAIDTRLSTIITTATAISPQLRYSFAGQLRDDIRRYQQGTNLLAKKKNIAPAFEFIKRHRGKSITAVIIAFLLVFVTALLIKDYWHRQGRWITVYQQDFTQESATVRNLEFFFNQERANPWRIEANGLQMERESWASLSEGISGDCRIDMEVVWETALDGIEIVINAEPLSGSDFSQINRGYVCQIGGYGGTVNFIGVNREQGYAPIDVSKNVELKLNEKTYITFQRVGAEISLQVGNQKIEFEYFAPIMGQNFARIYFHAYAPDVYIRKMRVSKLALPEKSEPIAIGDVLLWQSQYEAARDTYLQLAHEGRSDEQIKNALVRAFFAEVLHAQQEKATGKSTAVSETQFRVLNQMERQFPHSKQWEALHFLATKHFLASGVYDSAFSHLTALVAKFPSTHFINKITIQDFVEPWNNRVVNLFSSSPALRQANYKGLQISDLRFHPEVDLFYLNAENNRLRSLANTANTGVMFARLSDNMISDIKPLTLNPLSVVDFTRNTILHLPHADYSHMVSTIISMNFLENISALRDAEKLQILSVTGNFIKDISPIAQLPLRGLWAEENLIEDISSLAGKKIDELQLLANPIKDFSPLADVTASRLTLSGYTGEHLPISDRSKLQSITIAKSSLNSLRHTVFANAFSIIMFDTQIEQKDIFSKLDLMVLRLNGCFLEQIPVLSSGNYNLVDLANNSIADISQLNQTAIDVLLISGNPIQNFGGLLQSPPSVFHFVSPNIAPQALRKAHHAFKEHPELFKQAQISHALATSNSSALYELADSIPGGRLLRLYWSLSYEKADSIATLFGGVVPGVDNLQPLKTAYNGNLGYWISNKDKSKLNKVPDKALKQLSTPAQQHLEDKVHYTAFRENQPVTRNSLLPAEAAIFWPDAIQPSD